MNRLFKGLLIGLIGGPIVVLGYTFPSIFSDTQTTLRLMVSGATAGTVGFALLNLFNPKSIRIKAIISVVAGAAAGFVFWLLRQTEYSPFIAIVSGAVLLPICMLADSGFQLKRNPKSPPSP